MSTISIALPDEDLEFLRNFARDQGTSAEQFIAQQTRRLRLRLRQPLHPDVVAASGVFRTKGDPEEAWREHSQRKQQ
jgi:hypothetical protein